MKPILISGIQPTGRLHLGNYLGALKNFVELQNSEKYDCLFFIADLHALTENPEPKDLSKAVLNLKAAFIAAGLDGKKSVIFLQSTVPAHLELDRILQTLTQFGEARRMTQFKEKGEEKESANVGLFTYPVLQTADILLYNAQFVPVGEDQLQHLELARTLARKFNKKYGKTFVEPKALLTPTPRVMSLDNPQKKMSKSLPNGCLFIDDEPEAVKEKIKRAVTDSGSEIKYDIQNKPAISNLLSIYSALSGETIPSLEKKFADKNYSYFKSDLAGLVSDYFANFRTAKTALLKNHAKLEKIFTHGSKKASVRADKKIKEIKKKVGLF